MSSCWSRGGQFGFVRRNFDALQGKCQNIFKRKLPRPGMQRESRRIRPASCFDQIHGSGSGNCRWADIQEVVSIRRSRSDRDRRWPRCRSAGTHTDFDARLKGISPRLTFSNVDVIFPRNLPQTKNLRRRCIMSSERKPSAVRANGPQKHALNLRYFGQRPVDIHGSVTRNVYRFSLEQPVQGVDLRDAVFLLGSRLFRLAK